MLIISTYCYVQKLDDELLVQKQSHAITKLKKQLALQTEIQHERQRKALLQSKLKAITAEIEVCHDEKNQLCFV